MKTPQTSHGVLDIKTGKEITTPLGLPRNAPMKIELKNIKLAQFASQETNCYQASIYVDGKKSGTVRNDGQGGADLLCSSDHSCEPAALPRRGPRVGVRVGDAGTVVDARAVVLDPEFPGALLRGFHG